MEWTGFLGEILQAGPAAVVLIVAGYLVTKVGGIDKNVREINGSVKKLQVWTEMHEAHDTERFQGINDGLHRVEDKVDGHRNPPCH